MMHTKICAAVVAIGLSAAAVGVAPAAQAVGPVSAPEWRIPIPRLPDMPLIPSLEDLAHVLPRAAAPELPAITRAALLRVADVRATLESFAAGDRAERFVQWAGCQALKYVAQAESELMYDVWAQQIYDFLPDSLADEYNNDLLFHELVDKAVGYLAGRLSKLTAWNYLHDFTFQCNSRT